MALIIPLHRPACSDPYSDPDGAPDPYSDPEPLTAAEIAADPVLSIYANWTDEDTAIWRARNAAFLNSFTSK